MSGPLRISIFIWLCSTAHAYGQNFADPTSPLAKPPGNDPTVGALAPITPRPLGARVTKGTNVLPADAGQEWKDYDITPYTTRVLNSKRPEQQVIDWVLRETGYESWHGEQPTVLSADHNTLHVYHTPQVQAIVTDVVDRFVNAEAESHSFAMHVMTLVKPDWRMKVQPMLHSVPVHSQGTQAWILAREDASVLLGDFRKRGDFREHSAPHLLVANGQPSLVTTSQTRNFVRDITLRPDILGAFEPQPGAFDEGFSLELCPLLSLDGRTIDAVVKCNIDQLEQMVPVVIELPTTAAQKQRTKIEVPQTTACRFHERFRWPADKVLLVSLGVVATPTPAPKGVFNLGTPLLQSAPRAELLIMVESKGRVTSPTAQRPPILPVQK
jgi:hypothetical protein